MKVETIRVVLVDDHKMLRDGLKTLIEGEVDMCVVGEADSGEGALRLVLQTQPDVVVMDIVMPVMNGLDAAKKICGKCQSTKVLMLTQYDDEENVLASRQAGAMGFIPKAEASSKLLTGIRSVGRGDQSWIKSLT